MKSDKTSGDAQKDVENQESSNPKVQSGTGWVILAAFLNYFAIGITVVPLKLLINKRIAGDPDDPNSASAFTDTTNIFIYAFMSFMFGRYMSGFGDYVGRKPLFVLASLNIILTRFIYIKSTSATGFYIGALVGGTFDCFYYTGLAWICDLSPEV
jgi:MFS family permease